MPNNKKLAKVEKILINCDTEIKNIQKIKNLKQETKDDLIKTWKKSGYDKIHKILMEDE